MKKIICGTLVAIALAFTINFAQAKEDKKTPANCGFDVDNVCCIAGTACGCLLD